MRPDDCSLTPGQLARVRSEAARALKESGSLGVFPTPVSQIMSVARVEEVEEDVLNESFVLSLRAKVSGALKSALSKVLGLFHASEGLIFIDQTLMAVKKTFVRLHECAHGFLPWQRGMYAVVEDCEKSLDPDVADGFDREANVFASEVLFQLDTFHEEASSKPLDVFVPVRLSKKYGSSVYAAMRQYVSKSHLVCAVLVLNMPELIDGAGFRCSLRRSIVSERFKQMFGAVTWPESFTPDDKIGALIPMGKRRSSGKRSLGVRDSNGTMHDCVAEAFTQTYQIFVLIHQQNAMTASTIIMPR